MVQPSDNIKHQVLLHLGLNMGKDSADFRGLTFQGVEPTIDCRRIKVWGFHSVQNPNDPTTMIHTRFSLRV